ncbi:MAG: hypothetical protein UT28_C0001G0354 [Berkelbacteria bacterium GW2011_GWE1_39_12]|uniref:Uncharacterized protein n=1 Tax=Berkelbacteria bacterium GW2011_GWE1_39_12 TaxID=1618337 RepID=A0A0G4B407_9BACT|nr:MAG: hypothetical protein UT28_C0001G0354 [Berkelbacteria bacterium GW2011_GWE1_39_12]
MSKLTCKIGVKTGDEIEVEIEGRKVSLPASSFPSCLKEKDQCHLYLYSSRSPGVDDRNLAKSLLEEILNGK